MERKNDIAYVMKTLKKRRHEFIVPALTEIAENSNDPFKVLISCILSLRTRDSITAKASEKLYALADNPYTISRLTSRQIGTAIKSVNYYRTKAIRIKKISQEIVEKYNGKVPSNIEELLKFKGVGRKTANIVMVYGFHESAMPVDTHVHRLSNRLGWVETKTPEKTEIALRQTVSKRYWMDLNDLFVQFGQNICKPITPVCGKCPISSRCNYYKNVYSKNGGNKNGNPYKSR